MAGGEALPAFFCPISHMIMQDPVSTADGHSYERSLIQAWLQTHDTSPLTGEVLAHKDLLPNIRLRQAIQEWEDRHGMNIRRSQIQVDEPPISSGTFKTVCKGWLKISERECPVAVMKFRRGSCATEARIFLKLGRHPHLVRFMGQCIEGDNEMLLTELAPRGSLSDAFESLEGKVSTAHAIVFMHQICQGMEHLMEEKILHRDLGARNVLLFAFDERDHLNTCVKVSDFGLSVGAYSNTHVYGGQDEARPVRYMPPETLMRGRYSEKSDVWAFGVTAWEIMTHGMIPYHDIADDSKVIASVCKGGRLQRNKLAITCNDRLWNIMSSCWADKLDQRPAFKKLVLQLAQALGDTSATNTWFSSTLEFGSKVVDHASLVITVVWVIKKAFKI